MPDNYEVTITVDKDRRDEIFRDLKANGNELEKQAVKYSSVEPVLDDDGQHAFKVIEYRPHSKHARKEIRWMYRSTWSVAYPRS